MKRLLINEIEKRFCRIRKVLGCGKNKPQKLSVEKLDTITRELDGVVGMLDRAL